jgi:hypothetical protein
MAFKITVDYVDLKLTIDTDSAESVSTFVFAKSTVDYTVLKNVLTYTNLAAADITVDADSKNLYFSAIYDYDRSTENAAGFTVTMSDSPSLAVQYNRAFAEAYELTDVTGLGFSTTKAETVTMSESFTKSVAFARAFAETPSVADASVLGFGSGQSDSFSMAESISTIGVGKVLSETASVADSPSVHPNLGPSDTTSMSESLTRVVTFVRTISDSYALDDSASASDDLRTDTILNKANVVSISETLAYNMGNVYADSFSMAESSSMLFSPALAEALSIADAPAIGFSTPFSDSATISESILVELVLGAGARFNQSAFNVFTLNS